MTVRMTGQFLEGAVLQHYFIAQCNTDAAVQGVKTEGNVIRNDAMGGGIC